MKRMDYFLLAEKSLHGVPLTREECLAILHTPDTDVLLLLQAAFKIRQEYFGRRVLFNVLINAKSGLCPEDCGYCSQSSISTAEIKAYTLLPREELVAGAFRAREAGAHRYCLVDSGRGPTDGEVAEISGAVREITRQLPLKICCSLGLLTADQALRLKEAGVDRINHNLNTSERYYPRICSTHTYQDRLHTIANARTAGLTICSGGIVGMGEDPQDIIDLAITLRELDVESIPVNFLHPIPGTPLGQKTPLTSLDCLKALCLFRFVNPTKEIRAAGGREFNLKMLQPLALYPADSIFVGGYLTTPGQPPEEAKHMIQDMGLFVEC